MNTRIAYFIALLLALTSGAGAQRLCERVNPFIGTDFTGNTYPGAQVPFGMVQLSPDNGLPGWDRIAGYFYPDSTIAGFSHTHLLGTGAGDLYDISYLPVSQPLRTAEAPLGIHSRFSHESEVAHAGYYAVTLSDYNLRAELTATEHVGIMRYAALNTDTSCLSTIGQGIPPHQRGGGANAPEGGSSSLILNLSKAMNWDATETYHLEQQGSHMLRGYRFSTGWARHQKVYFCTRFSQPIDSVSEIAPGQYLITFRAAAEVVVCTALSAASTDAAEATLAAEAPHDNFDLYRLGAERQWDDALAAIQIECPAADGEALSADAQQVFYTALYHSLLCPTLYDGAPSGKSITPRSEEQTLAPNGERWRSQKGAGEGSQRPEGGSYHLFSLWDTYRAQHPLLTLVQPQRVPSMMQSLVEIGESEGRLPVWHMWGSETDMMIGYHAIAALADAYLKGLISDSLARRALALAVRTANIYDVKRPDGRSFGYVPMRHKDLGGNDWSLSRTLEYAYDDACISRLASALGERSIAREFKHRSERYRNVYNKECGFFVPKDSLGQWQPDFNPAAFTPSICESNAWPYLFNVQHDIPALCRLMGGKKAMAQKLDLLFEAPDEDELPIFSTGKIGQYVHGNEPSHHIAYLYNHVGQPAKTRALVSRICREMYTNTPAGLCGNEDCGQMSAWYVFSALGFYPVDPCGGTYELGVPQFSKIVLSPTTLPHADKAQGSSSALQHPSTPLQRPLTILRRTTKKGERPGVYLNGKRLRGTTITHKQILAGGTLEWKMYY